MARLDLAHQVRIGCSGWQYKHWRGDFYPAELPPSRWFAHYAKQFDTVEINNSFYRLPTLETFEKWREQAPRGFLYAVKASRFLTHSGPSFINSRPAGRSTSTVSIALCLHDMQGSATGKILVGPFVYVRFHHGTTKYGGRYSGSRLDAWADWLAERASAGMRVFAYFNNDTGGHAPRDAVRLRDRLRVRIEAA